MSLFGDKNSFALAVRSLGAPPPEPDPGAAATWARIQMWVQGKNLFEHTRRDTETYEDGVLWPAIYLARWFARSWDDLFFESPWPIPTTRRNARDVIELLDQRLIDVIEEDGPEEEEDRLIDLRDPFVATRALQAAAAGGALPDVFFSRHEDSMSIAWAPSNSGDTQFHLSSYGEEDVPAALFLDAVRGFMGWVNEQLPTDSSVDADKQLLDQWLENIAAWETPERALLHSTGLIERWPQLGTMSGQADNFEVFFELSDDWRDAGSLVQPSTSAVAMAFRCVAPILGDKELIDLRNFLVALERMPTAMKSIQALGSKIDQSLPFEKDYEQGYSLAVRLRDELQNPDDYFDIEDFLTQLDVPIRDYIFEDPDIDGAAICDAKHGPVILVNPASKKATTPWGRRMVLAHELCHLLFDRRDAVSLAVVSGPWAPPRMERRANAFAIELLLPKKGIKSVLGGVTDEPTEEEVQKLQDKFKVGSIATTNHLGNRFKW